MEVTKQSRRRIRLQNVLFYALFLTVVGLLAWLSTRYKVEADWTAGGRNTPSEATIALAKTIKGPVTVTAFVTSANEAARKEVKQLVGRYQRYKSDLALKFVNPDTEPALVRQMGIAVDGELIVEYDGRDEHIQELTEQALTNSLERLVRGGERWVVFLQGHGERNPVGTGGHDLGQFSRQLENKGVKVRPLNLTTDPHIPDNTAVLVIAGPQNTLLSGEVDLIENYLDKGGNLLWLADPGGLAGLEPVAEKLGVEFLPGTIVDQNTQLLGIDDPRFTLVADYAPHPITQNFDTLTLFPQARGMELRESKGWHGQMFLDTLPRSWAETGKLQGEIRYNAGDDIQGPLTIGVSLERAPQEPSADDLGADAKRGANAETRQRVVVVGDGDFLADAYLGQGGNLDLGLNIVNWLAHDENLIAIPAKTAPDRGLELSRTAQAAISIGFLLVLPLLLLGSGIRIWLVRRKR